MFVTLLITIGAVILFFQAKDKREKTGAVRTPQTMAFVAFTIGAAILWLKQIFSNIF